MGPQNRRPSGKNIVSRVISYVCDGPLFFINSKVVAALGEEMSFSSSTWDLSTLPDSLVDSVRLQTKIATLLLFFFFFLGAAVPIETALCQTN